MVSKIWFVLMLILSSSVFAQRDPTSPLGASAPTSTAVQRAKSRPLPRLQSIICNSDSLCVAVLNDKILSENQSVAGYKVLSISRENVVVAKYGKSWQLQLFNSNVRQ